MVHRDIKPQNLILAREGKKHIVKVLDFGLAKVMREKGEDTGLTGEGKMLGTPDYIAPEQTLDAARADICADIYSLGCTLYYLLSGHPPFSASSLGAIVLAHQMHEAKPLNLVRAEVPEELAAVVRKMMAKTPAKRYQTPLEVVQALSPFVKQGATPRPSRELSSGTREAKPAVKIAARIDPPPAPAAAVPKQQPQAAAVWESLMESNTASAGSRKSEVIRRPRAATVRERRSQKKWLMRGGLGVGALLLVLLGMWVAGVFEVKTQVKTDTNKPDAPRIADVADDKGFVPLFNGKDKAGWKTHPKQSDNWRVVKGADGNVLTCSGQVAGYLYSQRDDYKDFQLRIEARINDEGHGGVYIRAPFGPRIPQANPTYPIGYEALITSGNINVTGSLLDGGAGTTHDGLTTPTPPDQWFRMEVIAEGNHIKVKVNGTVATEYTDENRRFASGHIVLEQFGAGTKIEFRNIEIKELK